MVIAAIMAAGLGSRLGAYTKNSPKGLINIGQEPLISYSVKNLKSAGVSTIVVGTGHASGKYLDYFSRDKEVRCVYNPRYSDMGSMQTLYAMRDNLVAERVLLLESDIIYEPRALNLLMGYKEPDVVLASGFTEAGDECFIDVDQDNYLVNISKNKEVLRRIAGEMVGVSLLSREGLIELCAYWEEHQKEQPQMHYEDALVGIAKQRPIAIKVVPDLIWCEIDDAGHYQRATEKILPKVLKKMDIG